MAEHMSMLAKIRINDQTRKKGYALPPNMRLSPPLVVWKRKGCRHRLLRVFLDPEGWHVVTDGFREDAAAWMERMKAAKPDNSDSNFSLDAHRSGAAFYAGIRDVEGIYRTLPLETAGWPAGVTFEIGCRDANRYVELDLLISDVRDARATHRRKERSIAIPR